MLAIEQCATGFASFSLVQEKVCNTCGEKKHLSEFVIAGTDKRKGGRKNICKPCQRVKSAEFTKKNPGYWAERYRKQKEQPSTDDSWRGLDAALSMCQRTTPLQKAA